MSLNLIFSLFSEPQDPKKILRYARKYLGLYFSLLWKTCEFGVGYPTYSSTALRIFHIIKGEAKQARALSIWRQFVVESHFSFDTPFSVSEIPIVIILSLDDAAQGVLISFP